MAKDPVCGMDVEPSKAAGVSAYKGKTIYFCSPRCKERFDAEPEKFMGAAHSNSHAEMPSAMPGAHETAKDPICGMEVDESKAKRMLVHGGKKYYFFVKTIGW